MLLIDLEMPDRCETCPCVHMADGNSLLGDAATYNYLKNYLGSLCISLSGLGGVSTVAVREIKCKN